MEINVLQRLVRDQGLAWQPAETELSRASDAEKRSRLGAVPPSGAPSLAERELHAAAAPITTAPGLPTSVDWRNKSGNWVTPIEDQGACGSCVAFGTVASFESHVRIAASNAGMRVDLSEADLWFCWGPNHGAGKCPVGGWWPDSALPGLVPGIVDAGCFAYTANDQPCNRCADAASRLTKITGWHSISNTADMKTFLASSGPLITCFTVYDDFYHYVGGVYSPSSDPSNAVVGGHCVCIVGYDDTNNFWICKNSWGVAWGEQGFFRIAYGKCGIGAEMWAIDGVGPSVTV
jgi:C1A family cysteine protease